MGHNTHVDSDETANDEITTDKSVNQDDNNQAAIDDSLISKLPPEMLMHILGFVIKNADQHHVICNLELVCKHWRNSLRKGSRLWLDQCERISPVITRYLKPLFSKQVKDKNPLLAKQLCLYLYHLNSSRTAIDEELSDRDTRSESIECYGRIHEYMSNSRTHDSIPLIEKLENACADNKLSNKQKLLMIAKYIAENNNDGCKYENAILKLISEYDRQIIWEAGIIALCPNLARAIIPLMQKRYGQDPSLAHRIYDFLWRYKDFKVKKPWWSSSMEASFYITIDRDYNCYDSWDSLSEKYKNYKYIETCATIIEYLVEEDTEQFDLIELLIDNIDGYINCADERRRVSLLCLAASKQCLPLIYKLESKGANTLWANEDKLKKLYIFLFTPVNHANTINSYHRELGGKFNETVFSLFKKYASKEQLHKTLTDMIRVWDEISEENKAHYEFVFIKLASLALGDNSKLERLDEATSLKIFKIIANVYIFSSNINEISLFQWVTRYTSNIYEILRCIGPSVFESHYKFNTLLEIVVSAYSCDQSDLLEQQVRKILNYMKEHELTCPGVNDSNFSKLTVNSKSVEFIDELISNQLLDTDQILTFAESAVSDLCKIDTPLACQKLHYLLQKGARPRTTIRDIMDVVIDCENTSIEKMKLLFSIGWCCEELINYNKSNYAVGFVKRFWASVDNKPPTVDYKTITGDKLWLLQLVVNIQRCMRNIPLIHNISTMHGEPARDSSVQMTNSRFFITSSNQAHIGQIPPIVHKQFDSIISENNNSRYNDGKLSHILVVNILINGEHKDYDLAYYYINKYVVTTFEKESLLEYVNIKKEHKERSSSFITDLQLYAKDVGVDDDVEDTAGIISHPRFDQIIMSNQNSEYEGARLDHEAIIKILLDVRCERRDLAEYYIERHVINDRDKSNLVATVHASMKPHEYISYYA